MNDNNVRKVFDILGVEPYEKFKIKDTRFQVLGIEEHIYYIDEDLYIRENGEGGEGILCSDKSLCNLLNGKCKIVKLPKKKKLRDLTPEEYNKWIKKNCNGECGECIFRTSACDEDKNYCWIHNKDLYSDKFLDQEIEVLEE